MKKIIYVLLLLSLFSSNLYAFDLDTYFSHYLALCWISGHLAQLNSQTDNISFCKSIAIKPRKNFLFFMNTIEYSEKEKYTIENSLKKFEKICIDYCYLKVKNKETYSEIKEKINKIDWSFLDPVKEILINND